MFTEGMTYSKVITMVTEICCSCGVAFGLPSDLREQLLADSDKWFYCPNGHRQHFSKTTEQRLREQLASANNRISQKENEITNLQGQLTKTSRKLKRTEKRIANGVCPCCNRTFQDLQAHMTTKHPEYKK